MGPPRKPPQKPDPRPRPRIGRPPLPPEDALAHRLHLRITLGELTEITRAAAAAGLPVSSWARSVLVAAATAARRRPRR